MTDFQAEIFLSDYAALDRNAVRAKPFPVIIVVKWN